MTRLLESLTIENFAIIEKVKIDFQDEMTVLSGETGAGKSIIIDALGILCGGRGSSDYIRQGSQKLMIEGLFTFGEVPSVMVNELSDFGLDIDIERDNLIIRREINDKGKNTIRINGQLANVTLLKTIGSFLVDIHGQNEHQDLLDQSKHLQLLDDFGGKELEQLSNQYRVVFDNYSELRTQWMKAQQADADQQQRLNFLLFQMQEIENANLVEGEVEELEVLSNKIQNAQLISQNTFAVSQLLSDSDESILNQLDQVIIMLEEIKNYNPAYDLIEESLSTIKFDLEEYSHQLASMQSYEDDNQTLDEVEERLSELSRLKRKFGMDISEILIYYHEISEEVYQIQHRERYLEELEAKLISAYEEAYKLADSLHHYRKALSSELVEVIETELSDLYMKDSRFSVQFKDREMDSKLQLAQRAEVVNLNRTGIDNIEFYVATNVGEQVKPLVNVASGGELSRFMLALKTAFSRENTAKTMVFDEIDTGVSGRVAQAIAEKIREVAEKHQVLCITHLPQVAAISNFQLYIHKKVDSGRTQTQVSNLSMSERIEIIAAMISGKATTKNSLRLANELIEEYHT